MHVMVFIPQSFGQAISRVAHNAKLKSKNTKNTKFLETLGIEEAKSLKSLKEKKTWRANKCPYRH